MLEIGNATDAQPIIRFKTSSSGVPRIVFNDGADQAYIQYGHGSLNGEKLTVTPKTQFNDEIIGGDALVNKATASLTTTSASQTNRILASATTYRTIKVLVQIKLSTNFHATEILLTHNGTTVYMTDYATIFSNTSLSTFDADISGGNIRLLIDPNQSASTEFKFNVSGIEA